MGKSDNSRWFSLSACILLALATPQRASAYVDPGTGTMLWQVIAAAAIGSLFYVRRFVAWVREHSRLRSNRAIGFLFATCFAIITSPLILHVVGAEPMPRFNDVFLVGIVLTVYLFSWEPAVYLFLISLAVSAWIMPPGGSFKISAPTDVYRLVSFSAVSIFLIVLLGRRRAQAQVVGGYDKADIHSSNS